MSTKSITLTEDQIDELGRELDALRQRVVDDLGQADRDYSTRSSSGSAASRSPAARRCTSASCRRSGSPARPRFGVEDPRQHGDRAQRHARTVRLDARRG